MRLSDYLAMCHRQGQRGVCVIEELAQALEVSFSSVRHWSNGRRRPTPQHALKLEAITHGQVTRYDLRPDVYGPKPINNTEEKKR